MPPAVKAYKWVTDVNGKESAYGTPLADAALLDWIVVNAPPAFAVRTPTYRDDSAEMSGFAGPRSLEIESWAGEKAFDMPASPELYGWLLALILGNVVTTGAADPWTHTFKWPSVCVLNPPSTSILEGPDCVGATADYKLYKGVIANEVSIAVQGRSTIQMGANMQHDGSETAKPAVVLPTTPFVFNKLLGGQSVFKLGPLGTENLSGDFRAFSPVIGADAVVPDTIASGIFIGEQQYGENAPTLELDFTIKGDKSHVVYGYFDAATTVKLDMLIDKGVAPARSIQWKMDSAKVVQATMVPNGNETALQCKLRAQYNVTDSGPMTIVVKNGISGYLI
jgi:hypothetical protein